MNEFQNEVSGANNENVHIEGGEQYLNAQHNAQYGENVEYMENQIEENNFQENNQAYDTSNQNQEAQNEMKYEMVSFEMEENAEQNNVNNIENNENIEGQNINNGEEEQNIEEELEEEGEGEEEKNLSVNEKQENSEEKVGEEEDEEENIEDQLVDYVEENNKISKEQFNKKIKVYNINDNKNIKLDVNEEQDPETMIIVISTSVKSSKNGITYTEWATTLAEDSDNGNERFAYMVFLPDDPSIAGEQSVTMHVGSAEKTVSVTLVYLGDCETGTGWKIGNVKY